MDKNKLIEQISSKIDNLLKDERKTNEFAFQKLKEYVNKILQSSYKRARDDLGPGTVGGLLTLGMMGLGSLFSKPEIVDAAIKVNKDCEKTQLDLDEKWEMAKSKLDSLSTAELFWIMHINSKNGFESALAFLRSPLVL